MGPKPSPQEPSPFKQWHKAPSLPQGWPRQPPPHRLQSSCQGGNALMPVQIPQRQNKKPLGSDSAAQPEERQHSFLFRRSSWLLSFLKILFYFWQP